MAKWFNEESVLVDLFLLLLLSTPGTWTTDSLTHSTLLGFRVRCYLRNSGEPGLYHKQVEIYESKTWRGPTTYRTMDRMASNFVSLAPAMNPLIGSLTQSRVFVDSCHEPNPVGRNNQSLIIIQSAI
jgi:hypothetical protein